MTRIPLDLTQFTEHELVELNHKIVERLRFIRDVNAHHKMQELRLGDQVSFQCEAGHKVVGTILRLNRQSVSLIDIKGAHWRVAPAFLTKVEIPNCIKDVTAEVVAKPSPKNAQYQAARPESTQRDFLPGLRQSLGFEATPKNAPCPCGSHKKYKRCCMLKLGTGSH